jgi:hypothetical protein
MAAHLLLEATRMYYVLSYFALHAAIMHDDHHYCIIGVGLLFHSEDPPFMHQPNLQARQKQAMCVRVMLRCYQATRKKQRSKESSSENVVCCG